MAQGVAASGLLGTSRASWDLQAEAAFSAEGVVTRGLVRTCFAGAGGAFMFALLWPETAWTVVAGAAAMVYLAGALLRVVLAGLGRQAPAAPVAAAADILPLYTIIAPLYREGPVVQQFLNGLAGLDYPRERLQVLLALEADDAETLAAARIARTELPVALVLVPGEGPRTKPKALNVALAQARGRFVVVYDAEDVPEPDQLLKAAAAFARDPALACVQARLNIYNRGDRLLTQLFALDYALWFDLVQPGLARLGLPVPLGGTSNHFRTEGLRAAGGWDPYNVTEDADLGVRLARLGRKVGVIRSTTWEEAPAAMPAWVRQRTRWMKGFLQTWLVHMRAPGRTWRELRLGGFAALQLLLAGPVLAGLLNPLLWLVALAVLCGFGLPQAALAAWAALAFAATTALLVALHAWAAWRRGWHGLAPVALLLPLQWVLTAVASWLALVELVRAPSHWAKTDHGLTRAVAAPPAGLAQP